MTPCLNAARYIRATIDSVLSQDYPRLEYRVVDGGSSDGTLDIVRSYGASVMLLTGPDQGQSDAINKGLARSSGEICSWINASDCYLPGAFAVVARAWEDHPEAGLFFGRAVYLSEEGNTLGEYAMAPVEEMLGLNTIPRGHYQRLLTRRSGWIPQQTAFWRRSVMERAGLLDPALHYAMDYEYWLRLGRVAPIHFLDAPTGAFRLHRDAKSASAWKQWREVLRVNHRYGAPWCSQIHASFLRACSAAVARRARRLLRA